MSLKNRYTVLFAFSLLLGAACAAEDADGPSEPLIVSAASCGDVRFGEQGQPIVNGTSQWNSAIVALMPEQAKSVGAVMRSRQGYWSNVCTGTLVAPTIVVTAAHCVLRRNGSTLDATRLAFAVGPNAASGTMLAVTEVVAHEDYDPWTGKHDVAVLVLSKPAQETISDIVPLPYNCQPLTDLNITGKAVQTVGYGCTDSQCNFANTQRYWAVQDIIGVSSYDFIVDGYGLSGVCFGDSGGPAFYTMPSGEIRTLGTLSWGDAECGNQDHFASTHDHCDFLNAFVQGCGEHTEVGQCHEDISIYCDDGQVVTRDCAVAGQICGDNGSSQLRCIEPPSIESDDCDALAWGSYCEGDTAVWCHDGKVRRRRCNECDQTCGWLSPTLGYYCQ